MSTSMSPMNTPEIIQALTPLIEAFERLGIAYYIGGSVASSVHGRRRYTQDVDVVAALSQGRASSYQVAYFHTASTPSAPGIPMAR